MLSASSTYGFPSDRGLRDRLSKWTGRIDLRTPEESREEVQRTIDKMSGEKILVPAPTVPRKTSLAEGSGPTQKEKVLEEVLGRKEAWSFSPAIVESEQFHLIFESLRVNTCLCRAYQFLVSAESASNSLLPFHSGSAQQRNRGSHPYSAALFRCRFSRSACGEYTHYK